MSDFSTPLPSYTPDEILAACQGKLHPQAVIGIDLMNRGAYFEAHEALEAAWKEETGAFRDVYRGILQAAVSYLHIRRNNYRGARKMLARCQEWLAPFPATCRGIDLGKLRSDIRTVEARVIRLGAEGLVNFDPDLLKPLTIDPFIP
ncbi:MAG: DUF309 domain-containing protein [Anaerolineae bacterium]|nr:DUF309 domain-containing protein [Anaerolineae bacterium]